MYLVRLNRGNLLVGLDVLANTLGELLQGTLGNGLGHLGDLDHLVGIGPGGLHHGRQLEHGAAAHGRGTHARRRHARGGR